MKKFFVFIVLTCLLGNRALAQTGSSISGEVTEILDFSGLNRSWNNSGFNTSHIDWAGVDNYIASIHHDNNSPATKYYRSQIDGVYFIAVGQNQDGQTKNTDKWQIGQDNNDGNPEHSYLQMNQRNQDGGGDIELHNLKIGDEVTIVLAGNCTMNSDNTTIPQGTTLSGTVEFQMTTNIEKGNVFLHFPNQYSGIYRIEIKTKKSHFNYDPGYEVYDMFSTQGKNASTISISDDPNTNPGFSLNNATAQYLTIPEAALTLNNRVAVSSTGWTVQRGILAPQYDVDNTDWYNFSICNLKKGDRVEIFYTGTAPTFSSSGKDGSYDGCAAFMDKWNDGEYNPGENNQIEDQFVSAGLSVKGTKCRVEGNIVNEEGHQVWLYTSQAIVITEDGHLDLGLMNGNYTRIVKIKVYSDHQATMIDDYSERNYEYTSRFDITGELQAKEHIVPGGLEVRVGNEDKSQHAIVVSSKEGAVSYVNAVDGFKLPGVTGSVQDGIQINFDLGKNSDEGGVLPTTGTFYKFMPLENGTMKVKFTPYSMYYYRYDIPGNAIYYDDAGWLTEFDRANEQTYNRVCPYFVKVSDDNGSTFSDVPSTDITWTDGSSELANGAVGEFVLNVEAGNIYYLFGGWTSSDDYDNGYYTNSDYIRDIDGRWVDGKYRKIIPDACGVAELFDVAFNPAKQIYPLAKWVPSGTEADNDLAIVQGYHDTELTVKKMSGNITECEPYLYETDQLDENNNKIWKLGIRNIKFKAGANPGGVVLIKFGTNAGGEINYYKVDPVYAFTVAYDANYHSTSNYAEELRGHTWDFSTLTLNGLEWDPSTTVPIRTKDINDDEVKDVFENITSQNYAIPKPFGTYFNNFFANGETAPVTTSFLYKEMNYEDNGVNRSDWMFNYRLQKNGQNYDPRFLNKYDMEGDNADMIWDTEGIIIKAHSNTSCIFNEFGDGEIHESTKDPDRYVGILSGGSFLIPHLNKDDRVIIYMGSGTNADEFDIEDLKFHITNARDADYKPISKDDVYLAGGSLWNSANNDNNYRGCYHFFAKDDGDMEFTLDGTNSVCKLYKIQIYRGDRINTNDVVGETVKDKFLLVSTAKDPNVEASDNNKDVVGDRSNWTLKYFGKDQKLANGVKGNTIDTNLKAQNNEIVAQTGAIKSSSTFSTNATNNTFTYQHQLGEIGTIRVRAKDMEKNMNYVADYGEHNVTIAYQETQKYPYTWDFKDMTGWGGDATTGNKAMMFDPEDQYEPSDTPPGWFVGLYDDTEDDKLAWTKSYEFTSKDLSLWEVYSDNNGYFLRLNSQNGQTGTNRKERDNIFQTDTDPDSDYEGNQVWANKQVVPETKGLWFITEDNFNHSNWYISDDGMDFDLKAHTLVVPNVPADAAVYLRMEEIQGRDISWQWNSNCEVYGGEPQQVGTDYIFAIKNNGSKRNLKLNIKGYRLLKLAVSKDSKTVNIKGYASESRNRVIDHTLTSFFTGKPINAYLAKQKNESTITFEKITKPMPAATADGQFVGSVIYNDDNANDTGTFDVFGVNSGFHLFVPDMHDYAGDPNDAQNMVTADLQSTRGNMMKSFNAGGTGSKKLSQTDAKDIYVLSYKYLDHDREGQTTNYGKNEAFYRLASSGGNAKPNSAYIQLNQAAEAKVNFIFEDDLFDDVDNGIATGISEAAGQDSKKLEWYSLDGRKLNGAPTEKGLYIVNGKKVLVK